jgi:hypothetical protein
MHLLSNLLPDNSGHLVSVELYNRILDRNFLEFSRHSVYDEVWKGDLLGHGGSKFESRQGGSG